MQRIKLRYMQCLRTGDIFSFDSAKVKRLTTYCHPAQPSYRQVQNLLQPFMLFTTWASTAASWENSPRQKRAWRRAECLHENVESAGSKPWITNFLEGLQSSK